jgi:hypothetical protein
MGKVKLSFEEAKEENNTVLKFRTMVICLRDLHTYIVTYNRLSKRQPSTTRKGLICPSRMRKPRTRVWLGLMLKRP